MNGDQSNSLAASLIMLAEYEIICSTSISHTIAFGPKDRMKQHAGSGLAIIITEIAKVKCGGIMNQYR
jgi:hypothetical protein